MICSQDLRKFLVVDGVVGLGAAGCQRHEQQGRKLAREFVLRSVPPSLASPATIRITAFLAVGMTGSAAP